MTKKDLIKLVAERVGCTQSEAKEIIDTMLDVMTEALSEGWPVTLTGFGKLEPRIYGRSLYNTFGNLYCIDPDTPRVRFREGATLKRRLRREHPTERLVVRSGEAYWF